MRRLVASLALLAALIGAGTGDSANDVSLLAPAWSPDGANVAWVAGSRFGSQVWTAAPDGTVPNPVGQVYDGITQLAWTPAGFVLDAHLKFFLLHPDGTSTALGSGLDTVFSVDSKGTKVATATSCPACTGPVQVLDVRTHKVARVGIAAESNTGPSLSPDGARVVYRRLGCANGICGTARGLWIAPSKGGAGRRLVADGFCARWSPDGKTIAYQTKAGELRLATVASGKSALISKGMPTCTVAAPPTWSHDSHQLAFVAKDGTLRLADAQSHKVLRRSSSTLGAVFGISWSPDNTSLLLAVRPAGAGTCGSIWRFGAADGSTAAVRICG
jgi:Tol biopolymer transport system component